MTSQESGNKANSPALAWTVEDPSGKELIRLYFEHVDFPWEVYRVEYVGISPEDWRKWCEKDSRDVPFVLHSAETGDYFRFGAFWFVQSDDPYRVSVRSGPWAWPYPWWRTLVFRLGVALRLKTLNDFHRRRLLHPPICKRHSKRRVLRELKSRDIESLMEGLAWLPAVRGHARWIEQRLCEFADHRDERIRFLAASGFGEFARYRRPVDLQKVLAILERLTRDSDPTVRIAAEESRSIVATSCGPSDRGAALERGAAGMPD